MRERKYRIWTGKEMIYDDCLYLIDSSDGTVWKNREAGGDDLTEMEDCIPLDFTGLRDKTGREIWEGDVVKDQNGYEYIIIFEDGCLFGKNICQEVDDINPYHKEAILEVIGNIYEDPQLIKDL